MSEIAPIETSVTAEKPERPLAAGGRCTDWDEYRSQSSAIQREMMQMATSVLPDLSGIALLPLPPNPPPRSDAFGVPLATLQVPGESHGFNRTVGSFVIIVGCLLLIVAGIQLGTPNPAGAGVPIATLIGIVGIGAGLWFAFFRQPSLSTTLWIFEDGLLLQQANDMEACGWDEVRDFRTDRQTGRPSYVITTRENRRLILSPDQTPTIMPLAEYIQVRIASVQLVPRLKRLAKGERMRLGAITMDRDGMIAPVAARWTEITRVLADDSQVFVDTRTGPAWHPIPLKDVAMPIVLLALAHILMEDSTRLPAEDDA